jgi:hypothetical protein
MTELNLQPSGKVYDQFGARSKDGEVPGATQDAEPFTMNASVHFHDKCLGLTRSEDPTKFVPTALQLAIKEMGATEPDVKTLMQKAATQQGREALEGMLSKNVDEVLGNFCLTTDGVEINSIKTK